jgi:NADPH:quinone reductase
MRAVAISAPGGHEVLSVIERDVREPVQGEVRIAVKAAAVNPTDILLRTIGGAELLRMLGGGELPPPWVPGMDAAGIVEAAGEGVDRLHVGDEVMATVTPYRPEGGAQTELLVAPAGSVVPIPEGATLREAATLPMNGLTAMLGLDALGLEPGATLAVTGGAGLLASYVIPLAKDAGLRVVADAKPEDELLVRGFGADVVVPRGEQFVASVRDAAPEGVDGLIDTALLGPGVLRAIRDGGTMVVVRGSDEGVAERGIQVKPILVLGVLGRTDWLDRVRRAASEGGLQLRVADEYPPEEIAAAHEAMEAGGLRGRGIIVF